MTTVMAVLPSVLLWVCAASLYPTTSAGYGSSYEPLPVPSDGCHEPHLMSIINNLLRLMQDMPYREYEGVVRVYQRVGVDLSTQAGVHNITCYMASVRTAEGFARLFPGGRTESLIQGYRQIRPILKALDVQSLRQGLMVIRRVLQWIQQAGFPLVPLSGTSYLDTWQFFTDLQADLSETVIADVNVVYNLLITEFLNTFDGYIPYSLIYTQTPEALARVCHSDDDMQAYAMFDHPNGYYNSLQFFRYLRRRDLHQFSTAYMSVGVSMLELGEHLANRGWLDLQ